MPTSAQALTDIPTYGVYEVVLSTSNSHANPYTDVSIAGTFQGPNTTITIPGFWDGGSTWKIRMAPTEAGTWSLIDVASNDSQLNNQKEGTSFLAHQPTSAEIANNEVLRHGFIRISKAYPHTFEHADGTPFFPLGDTQWERAILSSDGLEYTGDQDFQAYQDNRSAKGFNLASMAWIGEGAFSNLHNEGGKPFIGSSSSQILNPPFFQAMDARVAYMTSRGIRPMLVLTGEGQWAGQTTFIDRYTKYLVARYGAYDVVWYGFKEYQEYGGTTEVDAFGNAIEATDPYNHPTSTHTLNHAQGTSSLNDRAWLDFHTLQFRTVGPAIYNLGKPVVITEAWYEGSGASAWGPYSQGQFLGSSGIWVAMMNGGYQAGYQYVANPRGNTSEIFSNLNTESIQRLSHMKKFFEATDFQKLVPHDELLVSGTAEVMAQELNENGLITGNEYVAYLANGGSITLNLSDASGTLQTKWYDPKTGASAGQTTTTGGGNRSFSAPSSGSANPWALHIYTGSSADNVPPAPANDLIAQ